MYNEGCLSNLTHDDHQHQPIKQRPQIRILSALLNRDRILQHYSLPHIRSLIIAPLLKLLPVVRYSRAQTLKSQDVEDETRGVAQKAIYLTRIVDRLGRHVAEFALEGRDERRTPRHVALTEFNGRVLLAWRQNELGVVLSEEALGWDDVLDQRGGRDGVVGVGWLAGLKRRDGVTLLAAVVVGLVVDGWWTREIGDPAAAVVLVGGDVGRCAEAGRAEVNSVQQG